MTPGVILGILSSCLVLAISAFLYVLTKIEQENYKRKSVYRNKENWYRDHQIEERIDK